MVQKLYKLNEELIMMTKKEACHELADINEKIYELENSLSSIEIKLLCDDERNREWYLERKAECSAKLEKVKQEHDDFISEYADIIYS